MYALRDNVKSEVLSAVPVIQWYFWTAKSDKQFSQRLRPIVFLPAASKIMEVDNKVILELCLEYLPFDGQFAPSHSSW
jgi:hypothetical protein